MTDEEFLKQHRYPCRFVPRHGEPCTVASCFFALDNRATYGHLCWKHAPQTVADDPAFYLSIPY